MNYDIICILSHLEIVRYHNLIRRFIARSEWVNWTTLCNNENLLNLRYRQQRRPLFSSLRALWLDPRQYSSPHQDRQVHLPRHLQGLPKPNPGANVQ